MRKLNQKQYAAFAANAKTLDSLRRNEVNYVPGVFEVTKVIVLGKEDFEKLSEDVSPEYPFLKDNRELMSADPGGLFRCLMVRTKGEQEYMLIAQGRNILYLGYGKDCRKVNLQDVPMEHLVLEEPKAYQEHAVFYHRPHDLSDINGQNLRHPAPERQTEFRVEQVVVLADEEYRQFQETRFLQDQIFLFDYQDKMWFDPGSLCWHCVLVKGENSRDGILVESEGFKIVQGIISTIITQSGLSGSSGTTLPQEIIDKINNVGFWDSIPLWAVTLLGGLFITVLSFIMILTVYSRMFKLYMYTALAPIPLSSFAGEPTSNVGKNFLRSYAGVCLEGAIIALACIIFSVMAASPPAVDPNVSAVTAVWSYVGELIFNLLVLVGAVRMSDRIVKELLGL